MSGQIKVTLISKCHINRLMLAHAGKGHSDVRTSKCHVSVSTC